MTNSRAAASSGPERNTVKLLPILGERVAHVCSCVCACESVPYIRGRMARTCGFYYCIFTLSRLLASTRVRSTSRPIEHLKAATQLAPSFSLDLSTMGANYYFFFFVQSLSHLSFVSHFFSFFFFLSQSMRRSRAHVIAKACGLIEKRRARRCAPWSLSSWIVNYIRFIASHRPSMRANA